MSSRRHTSPLCGLRLGTAAESNLQSLSHNAFSTADFYHKVAWDMGEVDFYDFGGVVSADDLREGAQEALQGLIHSQGQRDDAMPRFEVTDSDLGADSMLKAAAHFENLGMVSRLSDMGVGNCSGEPGWCVTALIAQLASFGPASAREI